MCRSRAAAAGVMVAVWLVMLAAVGPPAGAQVPATAYVANAGSTLVTQYAIGAGGLLSPRMFVT